MNKLVEMKNIHKSFGEVVALRGIDFTVKDNEVVGILGDNGAGKSTLIKMLAGVVTPTKGDIYIKGEKINPRNYSVKKARKLGIETVYQEKALGDLQPLWRNIFIGRHCTNRLGFINVAEEKRETDKIMRELIGLTGGGASCESSVKTLSGGERQGVAIGRAMYFDADLVILDEPTMALSLQEVDKVLNFIRKIKEMGKACIYISHNISYVYPVSERFVLMDRGQVIVEYKKEQVTLEELMDKVVMATQVGKRQ